MPIKWKFKNIVKRRNKEEEINYIRYIHFHKTNKLVTLEKKTKLSGVFHRLPSDISMREHYIPQLKVLYNSKLSCIASHCIVYLHKLHCIASLHTYLHTTTHQTKKRENCTYTDRQAFRQTDKHKNKVSTYPPTHPPTKLTDLTDQHSELIKISQAVWSQPQFTDSFVEFLRSLKRILLIRFLLHFSKVPRIL